MYTKIKPHLKAILKTFLMHRIATLQCPENISYYKFNMCKNKKASSGIEIC